MNKRPGDTISSNREKLERELLDDALNGVAGQNAEVDTGRKHHSTGWQTLLGSQMHKFATRQGLRRRHPDRLLQQHEGALISSKKDAHSYATDSLRYDQQRVELPQEYEQDKDAALLANQYYLVQVAAQNAKNSREKILNMVGVMM